MSTEQPISIPRPTAGKRRTAIAAMTAVIALTLSACGDNGDASPTTTPTASSSETSATTSTASSATSSTTPVEEPEPVVEEPAAVEPEPAAEAVPEQQGIWAPPGEGIQCPGTDAFVWDYADCNPSNGVIDPDEFYRIIEENQQPDPSTIPVWQGGTCSYAECGYPPGEPAPGTMQAEVAEGCRSGQLVGAGCDQYL